MSFAFTAEAILAQRKTVTRRMAWRFLKPGEVVQPVKQAMGLRKGQRIVKLGPPIRVTGVRRERLARMLDDSDYGFTETRLEGYSDGTGGKAWPSVFVEFFCAANNCTPDAEITRIEFTYTGGGRAGEGDGT